MKKMVFLDVDGTLVGHDQRVSKPVRDAIEAARKNGHGVFLCTGRNRAGIQALLNIGFDGMICSAGGYIEVNGQVIHTCYLTEAEVNEARDIFDRHHVLYNMEATDTTFQSEEMSHLFVSQRIDGENANSELARLMEEQKNTYNIHALKDFDAHPLPIHKLCFIAGSLSDLDEAKEKLSDRFHFIIHEMFSKHTLNGEIINKKMDKGMAVKKVAAYFNVPLTDTIGIGDSMNDLEMIQTCGTGVVMANGSEALKKHADMICESVEKDGVADAFKQLGLY